VFRLTLSLTPKLDRSPGKSSVMSDEATASNPLREYEYAVGRVLLINHPRLVADRRDL
jgi:hypothetical protein